MVSRCSCSNIERSNVWHELLSNHPLIIVDLINNHRSPAKPFVKGGPHEEHEAFLRQAQSKPFMLHLAIVPVIIFLSYVRSDAGKSL